MWEKEWNKNRDGKLSVLHLHMDFLNWDGITKFDEMNSVTIFGYGIEKLIPQFLTVVHKTTLSNSILWNFKSSLKFSKIFLVKTNTRMLTNMCKSIHSLLLLQSVFPKLLEISWINYDFVSSILEKPMQEVIFSNYNGMLYRWIKYRSILIYSLLFLKFGRKFF